jgi:predicted transcriptional regulator of viral defense system
MDAQVPKRQGGAVDWGVFGTADGAIARIEGRQRGVVTRAQLFEVGLTRNEIGSRLRNGRLHPLYRGVYLVGHAAPAPGARELGAVLACGPGAVLSHRSAAALWKLLPSVPRDISVTVAGRDSRGTDGIKVHRVASLPRREVRKLGPIPITSPARTLLDIAPTASPR